MIRRQTRSVRVGAVCIGGGAPVSVQTMLDDDPHDVESIASHIESCRAVGADIVRLAIPDVGGVAALAEVKRRTCVPVVSDIHFDYRLALGAIEAGTDALRLNPGNIGPRERVREVARAAMRRGIPIRIGVNGGSLEKGAFITYEDECTKVVFNIEKENSNDPNYEGDFQIGATFFLKTLGGVGTK